MVETEITPCSVKGEIGTTTKTTKLVIPCCIAKSDTGPRFSNLDGAGCITALNVVPLCSAHSSKTLDLGEGMRVNRGLDGHGGAFYFEGGKR
jgi:hypothetical protein